MKPALSIIVSLAALCCAAVPAVAQPPAPAPALSAEPWPYPPTEWSRSCPMPWGGPPVMPLPYAHFWQDYRGVAIEQHLYAPKAHVQICKPAPRCGVLQSFCGWIERLAAPCCSSSQCPGCNPGSPGLNPLLVDSSEPTPAPVTPLRPFEVNVPPIPEPSPLLESPTLPAPRPLTSVPDAAAPILSAPSVPSPVVPAPTIPAPTRPAPPSSPAPIVTAPAAPAPVTITPVPNTPVPTTPSLAPESPLAPAAEEPNLPPESRATDASRPRPAPLIDLAPDFVFPAEPANPAAPRNRIPAPRNTIPGR